MFQVLVKDDPALWEYFAPVISAVRFLILLGSAAVFVWPDLLEKKILPKFHEKHHDMVMFSIMTVLLLGYLPLLNYMRASYLSGTFLARMSFSQIHLAYESFIKHTHQLMIWLLRVFFAALIGFQISVTKFCDLYVIAWGLVEKKQKTKQEEESVYLPSEAKFADLFLLFFFLFCFFFFFFLANQICFVRSRCNEISLGHIRSDL